MFNFIENIFIGNFSVQTKDDENLAAVLFLKLFKARFHALAGRVIAEICFCCDWLDLDAERFASYFSNIFNISRVVKLRIAFFKNNLRKFFC